MHVAVARKRRIEHRSLSTLHCSAAPQGDQARCPRWRRCHFSRVVSALDHHAPGLRASIRGNAQLCCAKLTLRVGVTSSLERPTQVRVYVSTFPTHKDLQ